MRWVLVVTKVMQPRHGRLANLPRHGDADWRRPRLAVQLDHGDIVLCPMGCFRGDGEQSPPVYSARLIESTHLGDECWLETSRKHYKNATRMHGDSSRFAEAYEKANRNGGMIFAQGHGGVLYVSCDSCRLSAYGPGGEQRVIWSSELGKMLPITRFTVAGGLVAGLRCTYDMRGAQLVVVNAVSGDVVMRKTFEWCNLPTASIALWLPPSGGFVVFYGGIAKNESSPIVTLVSNQAGGERYLSHTNFGNRIAGVHGNELCSYSYSAVWLSDISADPDCVIRMRHNRMPLEHGIDWCEFSSHGHIAVLYETRRAAVLLRRCCSTSAVCYTPIWLYAHQHPQQRTVGRRCPRQTGFALSSGTAHTVSQRLPWMPMPRQTIRHNQKYNAPFVCSASRLKLVSEPPEFRLPASVGVRASQGMWHTRCCRALQTLQAATEQLSASIGFLASGRMVCAHHLVL